MFIRCARTRTTRNGKSYHSYRLVDSYRVGDRVRQRTLLNLGSEFDCPRELWPELTQRIEHIIRGQHETLLAPAPEVERKAQDIAATLLSRYARCDLVANSVQGNTGEPECEDPCAQDKQDQDLHSVDLNSLVHMDSRSVGAEALALAALERVQLADKLEALGFNRSQVHVAVGNIVGRMVQPASELSTHRWLQEHSALGELLGFDYGQQGLSALYRASDLLWKHHDEIESFLYRQHCALFNVEETITLYDLTNTFFEGTGKYNDHAAFGHFKEKRSDCPLVTLALVLDGSGFSRRSRIFAGNVSEPATLQKMIDQLRTPIDAGQKGEGGAHTERPEGASQQPLDLRNLPTIVMDAGVASEENVTWLREQGYPYIVVSRKRHLEFDENRCVAVKEREHDTVRAMRVEREDDPTAHPGVYCLRSNQSEWDEAQLWRTYTLLTDLEAVFRSLKSELGMRPVYHQKTHRVEGHIFITLLAYNLVHQIRLTLKAQGIDDSWETIRTTMGTQMRITTTLRGAGGEQIHIRKSTYPNASQQVLLRALGLGWHPGQTEKTIITP